MVYVVFLSICFTLKLVTSENFFVDCNNNGNDQNSGTSEKNAWRTLNRVNVFQTSLQPGDKIFFKNGCVWNEKLEIYGLLGEENNPIVFSNYGNKNEPKPIFSGEFSLNNMIWSKYLDTNIYFTDVNVTVGSIGELFFNGEVYNISHYPPKSPYAAYYITKTTNDNVIHVGNDFLQLSDEEIIGAYLMARVAHWCYRPVQILSLNRIGGSITVKSTVNASTYSDEVYNYKLDFGFYLFNGIWMMKEKTWVYDELNRRIYVWCEGNKHPNEFNKFFSKRKNFEDYDGLVSFGSSSHIVFENIHVRYSAKSGIVIGGDVENIVIRNCVVEYCRYGLELSGWANMKNVWVLDNKIIHSQQTGITFWGGGLDHEGVKNCLIQRNEIIGVGEFGGLNRIFYKMGTEILGFNGITLQGKENVISDNTIQNTGICGIHASGWNHLITSNYIRDIGTVMDDCGMVYMWTGGNHSVIGNLGIRGIGNPHGTPTKVRNNDYLPINGVYTDDISENVFIEFNTMIDTMHGLLHHIGRHHTAQNNIFFDSFRESVYIQEDAFLNYYGYGNGYSVDHNLNNNIFHTLSNDTSVLTLLNEISDDVDHFVGTFRNNQYLGITDSWFRTNDDLFQDLKTWQKMKGWGNGSKILGDPFFLPRKYAYEPVGGNLVVNGDFTTNINGWSFWSNWSFPYFSLEHYQNGLKSSYIRSPKTSAYLMAIYSGSYMIEKDQSYVVKYSLLCSESDIIYATFRLTVQDYSSIGYNRGHSVLKNEKSNFEEIYTHKGDTVEARFDFSSPSDSDYCIIDDVVVQKIKNFKYRDTESDYCIVYNTDLKERTINLRGKYCDINGKKVKKITLQKRRSAVVMNCFGEKKCPLMSKEGNSFIVLWIVISLVAVFCVCFLVVVCIFALLGAVAVSIKLVKGKGDRYSKELTVL